MGLTPVQHMVPWTGQTWAIHGPKPTRFIPVHMAHTVAVTHHAISPHVRDAPHPASSAGPTTTSSLEERHVLYRHRLRSSRWPVRAHVVGRSAELPQGLLPRGIVRERVAR